MSFALHHECTRVPVTAVASCGALLLAAEGPFLRFYHASDSRFISSQRVFKAQPVHGITVYSEQHDHVTKLIVWGGRHVRALEVRYLPQRTQAEALSVSLSNVATAPDWIFDLAPRPTSLEELGYRNGTCAAVTAHNALLRVLVQCQDDDTPSDRSHITVSISELTSSTRSILYSAHLFWDSSSTLLVVAGTAFGEIMYWSWSQDENNVPISRTHRIFTGHEGSIFGVRISKELPSECCQQLRRVIASCSDDRTIRIWDVSDVDPSEKDIKASDEVSEVSRTRHTGFSNESFDAAPSTSSECLAIGWGHTSRIWTIRFLETTPCGGSLFLKSSGEDATARIWELLPSNSHDRKTTYKLSQLDCAGHHSGKNLWATDIFQDSKAVQHAICGGADSKITASPLPQNVQTTTSMTRSALAEYTIDDVLTLAEPIPTESKAVDMQGNHRSSKKAEFFRSYCFVDADTFLLTTNSGKVLLGSLRAVSNSDSSGLLAGSTCIATLDDLAGYSVCTSGSVPGIAFIAGASGNIYVYRKGTPTLAKVYCAAGKVGDMLTTNIIETNDKMIAALLITVVGQEEARLLYVDVASEDQITLDIAIPIDKSKTGLLITSMIHVIIPGTSFTILGFRRGTIAIYSMLDDGLTTSRAALYHVINRAHADETVTCLKWVVSPSSPSLGHLISVGRDGRLLIHQSDLSGGSLELVSRLSMPIGPNIEGVYFRENHLMIHGFSNKRWVLYDVTSEEEVMGVETGGAHRSWAYQPCPSAQGGTLVWTRASSMHIYSQIRASHTVIRSGGHGREIKAVAISPKRDDRSRSPLIATGAEDTDIKIFEYIDGELNCVQTLRKHTTGIQHLQWSHDGKYLFSSGGCEELYIWRVRDLPSNLGVGIVCEHVYVPESEHADLRIMSFDVRSSGPVYKIAMVFSDSSMKVYHFSPISPSGLVPLARGLYFTSCLTQCTFLPTHDLLTVSTDGHAVVWPVRFEGPLGHISALNWEQPTRIHQNASKTMATHALDEWTMLIVSGGDDGSLAFMAVSFLEESSSLFACPPVLVSRTHGSAVTSCAIVTDPVRGRTFILTSGNDEWVRLWEVGLLTGSKEPSDSTSLSHMYCLDVSRRGKIKTNVADVSSMAVLATSDENARVLLCGVGMEVVRLDWDENKLV
ncbi:WD repeat protein-like protein [Plenodomus tracheiphilus IPT5]|uniref:WD repeat protein-like protein n=1 Tax=Plenodomus tracheiphilus IPT5 TaxID=1408161 RepID=A0A6A7BNB5_9PLEO|nr:WD repeat protein-like protein [Plenodomus tracheiphilus IPT5]